MFEREKIFDPPREVFVTHFARHAGAALRAPSGLAAYAASKAALLRLVESFADELKGAGVRLNAVLPSIIDTPQNRADMPKADPSKWVTPQEVAEAVNAGEIGRAHV